MVYVYSGDGHGKSPAAWGKALQAAAQGKHVVIIQFLKGTELKDNAFIKRLEPEIKLFRFEKAIEDFANLSPQQKQDEILNIRNGMNFAKKVLGTGECSLLILDEVLGLLDMGILKMEELREILDTGRNSCDIILTGITLCHEIRNLADEISRIETLEQ